jgi:ABC-type lipoprotein release transport system permease subunit
MSLLNFRYLNRRRILTLIAILTVTSTLFLVTAYSFLGFYDGFTNYVGEERDIVAVYNTTGKTPFTGVIPIAAENEIEHMRGIVATSAEVIAPCTVEGHSVFVRGVVPQDIANLNALTITQGQNLGINDTYSAMIGQAAAQRLNLKTGGDILVFSVLSQKYVQVQIKGVFQSQSSLNDEVLVPLYTGQWLRGLSYDSVTLIRVKIDTNQTSAQQLYKDISNQNPQPTATPSTSTQTQQQFENLIPLSQTKIIQNIGVEQSQEFMTRYLNRYGISKDTIILLSVMVLVLASGTALAAITLFVKQHANDIDVIRSVGASSKKIKIDLTLRMLFWALIATAVGTVISAVALLFFQATGYFEVLSHTISFQLEPIVIAANFAILVVLVGVNVARSELKG